MTYWELAVADQGRAQASWSYVLALQSAVGCTWSADGMKKVLQSTKEILDSFAPGGGSAPDDGPDLQQLAALGKVLEKCPPRQAQ